MKIAVARVKYGCFLKLAIEIYGFFAKAGQVIDLDFQNSCFFE
jgi:hypothetical protein